jgi:hypothetical protein
VKRKTPDMAKAKWALPWEYADLCGIFGLLLVSRYCSYAPAALGPAMHGRHVL